MNNKNDASLAGNGALERNADLEAALAALSRDYSRLSPRIRTLEHTVSCECNGVVLRLHFPSFRQGQATVQELTDCIIRFLTQFAMPRTQVAAVSSLYGTVSEDDFIAHYSQLSESARRLFKQANEATNRNGEAGELLLYLLTEWVLSAPQIIAKMSLKTNRQMPVHGADGVHAKYCSEKGRLYLYWSEKGRLYLYWGESKLYADVGQSISAAVRSIVEALDPEKMKHEIELVQRNIDFSGLDDASKQAFLRYLDPFEEAYNERYDVTTCLIGFDFEAFKSIAPSDADSAEAKFAGLAQEKLKEIAPKVSSKLVEAGLAGRPLEIFFFPVPSVQEFRDLFQTKIGWKK